MTYADPAAPGSWLPCLTPGVNTPPLASMPATTFAAVTSVVTDLSPCSTFSSARRVSRVWYRTSYTLSDSDHGTRTVAGWELREERARAGRGGVRVMFGVCGAGDGGARVANPRRRSGEGSFASDDDDGAPGRVF